MKKLKATLITGRTLQQGVLVEARKLEMSEELAFCEMHPSDMGKIDVKEGELAVISANGNEVTVKVISNSDLPAGLIFTPISPLINKLISYTRSKRGILSGKGIEVNITKKSKN